MTQQRVNKGKQSLDYLLHGCNALTTESPGQSTRSTRREMRTASQYESTTHDNTHQDNIWPNTQNIGLET